MAGGDQRELFELDVDALLNDRSRLESSILASSVEARRVMATSELPVRRVGQHLFETVMTRSVYGAYRASLGVAQQHGKRLRVVLRLVAPELAALPWEALFDPERQTYLCRQEPMVRRVPAQFNPRAALDVAPPLQVLAVVASPRGLAPLDTDRERANLEEALSDLTAAGRVNVTWVEPATWRSIHQKLISGRWHIVHFIGHGDYDEQREEGVLAFVGSDGRADMVEASRFADLLGEADPTPRLVVLNACSTGEAGAEDMLSATAPSLVHSGIEAVAAMQFAVSDDAAIAFAQGFYTAVAYSRGVDEAARSGRIAMLGAAGSLEWLTPVLYLRGDSTHPIVVLPY
jgi:CHAT domain-containing protein